MALKNCETPCTADDDDDCDVDTEVYGYPYANKHVTRFVENCMGGYKEYIHVCYNDDAKDEIGVWGWNMASDGGGPIGEHLDGIEYFDTDSGDTDTYSFCAYIAGAGPDRDEEIQNEDALGATLLCLGKQPEATLMSVVRMTALQNPNLTWLLSRAG